jgi:hypothetical protein
MIRRIFLFAALTSVGSLPICAQDSPAPPAPIAPVISTSASQAYPLVTCTSADALACADTLQLAADTRDQLKSLLKLGPTWRFAVHIHIMTPDDPLTAKINREASAVFSQGATMKIEAVLPSSDPNAREFIQRQFVTAILWEKSFANTTSFDKSTHLDVVPFWLVEGLREWLNEDPEHNRESIVRRAVQNQSAPTLAEVASWNELSDDRLLGIWQRAFCYYLVDSITQQGPRRDDFQQWLNGFNQPNPPPAQYHFPTETDWQRELVDASDRSHALVYTWAETLSQLTADETITYALSKDAPVQTCTLDDITKLPHEVPVFEALQERIYVLTELELRAHPSWSPVIELYSSAITALIKNNQIDFANKLLQEAHQRQLAEMDHHQKMLDYANWFEVTKDYTDDTPHFGSYFDTAKEMERIQADPAHPNPIRANLLQIESEL